MNIANIYRDRTLDMLSEENVGETVRVAGWVENTVTTAEYLLLT